MTDEYLRRHQRLTFAVVTFMALGPLAALTFGEKYADKETLARAEAVPEDDRRLEPLASYELPPPQGAAQERTVVDVVTSAGPLETFSRMMTASGFAPVLRGEGPFTLFVPTDAAFNEMPADERQALFDSPEKMNALLSRHVVHGRVGASELMQAGHIETLGGSQLPVGSDNQGMLSIGGASLVQTDQVVGNGVVHIIDSVRL